MQQLALTEFSSDGSTECPTCGRSDFASNSGMKMHHARTHGESLSTVDIECSYCGVVKERYRYELEDVESPYCSSACLTASQRDRVEVNCSWCGGVKEVTPMEVEHKRRFFCDLTCKGRWRKENRSGENSGRWNGGKVSVECAWCGAEKQVYPSRAKEYDRHFCDTECRVSYAEMHLVGPNHCCWKGGSGIYTALRATVPSTPWNRLKRQARRRDDYTCQMCDEVETEDGVRHDVHHIIPIRSGGVNELWNVITLCTACHMKAEAVTRSFIGPIISDVMEEGAVQVTEVCD